MSTPSRLSDLNHIESSDVRIYHRNIIRTPIKIKNFDERNKIESFNILVINKV